MSINSNVYGLPKNITAKAVSQAYAVEEEELQPVFIEIRKAAAGEKERIWDLLHAEGCGWNSEAVEKNLQNLYVLRHSGDIVAVMHAFLRSGKLRIDWTAVHPAYPVKPAASILQYAVSGIALRKADV